MDWEKMRQEYVAGSESLASLAKKYDVSEKAARSRAQRGKWKAQRDAFRAESGAKALESAQARAARAHARSLEKLVESSMLQEELIYEIFREAKENESRRLSPGKMLQLSLALETAVKTRRNLMGLPTQEEKFDQKIKRERLKLDKQRAGAEDGAAGGVTVEILTPEGINADEVSG